MTRDCESCGARYNDEFAWTICPHLPLEVGAVPYHPRTNPNGYCRRCDRIGAHDCLEVEDRSRAQERQDRAVLPRRSAEGHRALNAEAGVRAPAGQPILREAQALPVRVEVDAEGRHVTTASEAPLPHGFTGAGIVLRESQRLELLSDGSARIRRSPTDEWEHHEANTEMAQLLWLCAAPLKPMGDLATAGTPMRIVSIDYVNRVIVMERA